MKFKHVKLNTHIENSNHRKKILSKICNDQMMFRNIAVNYILRQCVSML